MYKMLVFLKKTDEDSIKNHFDKYTLKYLANFAGKEIEVGEIESNLLTEEKYNKFCEVTMESKNAMDEKLASAEGKELQKDLADFHQYITFIFVKY